jgi:hypothetical protein
MLSITLAIEDELSEVVCRRLIAEHGEHLVIGNAIGRRGSGYLRSRLPSFIVGLA